MEYTIYNKQTGKILRTGYVPKIMAYKQINNKNEAIIQGKFPEDGRIINGEFVPKKYPYPKYKITSPGQVYQYAKQGRGICLRSLQNIMSKQEAEDYIKEHYKEFRAKIYPDRAEFLDAQVKIELGNAEQKEEGEQQLQEYFQNCMQVKKEFPKK